MTIQNSIAKKIFLAKILGFIFWIAFSMSMLLPLEKEYFILSLIPFIGFGCIVVFILFLVRCPSCHASIGRVSMSGVSLFKSDLKIRSCPYCKVDFMK